MSSRTASRQAALEHLRTEYRDAFERWAREIVELQNLRDSGCAEECSSRAEAQALTEVAEMTYRTTRDRLAASMMDPLESGKDRFPSSDR